MSPVCVPPHQASIPTLLGQVMGGATWGALLGSVAAAVDHVSEIALFWMCLLDACLYLQIVNTDLNKKKHSVVACIIYNPARCPLLSDFSEEPSLFTQLDGLPSSWCCLPRLWPGSGHLSGVQGHIRSHTTPCCFPALKQKVGASRSSLAAG